MEGPSRYRIGRVIKRGGMSEVFEALMLGAQGFERRVAIKRLLPALAEDESAVRAFIDEARILSHLHHGNIVSVLDFGVFDGVPFQALELIDGTDAAGLEERLGHRLPDGLVAYIAQEIASALDYAHGAEVEGKPLGIIHRDVSPDNVLLAWTGEVKLADFGVAFARERLEATALGLAKGKPDFMAPEQLRGDPLDARADVFALGCTLHLLLTGKSPVLRGVTPGVGDQSVVEQALEADLRAIVARATAPSREARYASAASMAVDLRRAVSRRVPGDPRLTLRDRLASLKEKSGPSSARQNINDLFNLELFLEAGPPEPSRMRRFRSVIAGPEHEESTHSETPEVQEAPDDPSEDRELSVGTLLHSYRIEEIIGRGSSGVVYRARHSMLPTMAAIKVLKRADRIARRRLEREVTALMAIKSPHVVELRDLGMTPSGHPFLVMELVAGSTLKELISRDAPIDAARAAEWARQIALGLEAVHAAGWVHRDLKPANVAVLEEGGREVLKLLDFGLLRGGESTRMTALNAFVGTPAYMAPEQIMDPSTVTSATDLYSLGVILHSALAAKPLFRGSLQEVLEQHQHRAPSALPARARPLEPLVNALLAKEAADRPSAAQVLAMLAEIPRSALVAAESEPRVRAALADRGDTMTRTLTAHQPADPATQLTPPRTTTRAEGPRVWPTVVGLLLAGAGGLVLWSALGPRVAPTVVTAPPPPAPAPPSPSVARGLSPDPVRPPVVATASTSASPPSPTLMPAPPSVARESPRPSPRGPRRSAEASVSERELSARVQRALDQRGLVLGDLGPEGARLHAEWTKAVEGGGPEAARATAALLEAVAKVSMDRALVERKLSRVREALKAAMARGQPGLDPLETQYLALRERAGAKLSAAEAEALARDVRALERAVSSRP